MSLIYTCPTIPQNLRKEETYVQIAEALNYLSDVSEDIFQRLNGRINANRDKLSALSLRIQTAQTKIQRISTAKHAVQIFSSSKYPAAGIDESPYQSVFATNSILPIKRFDYRYKAVNQAQDEPLEKLEFYHESALVDTMVRLEGLGNVPGDSAFVGDLLFYNSGKNAYKQSVPLGDPLERAGRTGSRKSGPAITELNLGDAPRSIADKNADPLNQIMRADSYFYFPDIGDVPTLDVPLDLPDLPGIADDVHYITDKELSIAPSLQHGHSKLVRNTNETTKQSPTPIIEETKIIVEATATINTSNYVQSSIKNNNAAIEKSNETAPDAAQELPESQVAISEDSSVDIGDSISGPLPVPVFSPVDDPHVTLMEAIRKAAGGRNLKSTKASTESSNVSSGDLMIDLHTKLLRRRKGISGNKASGSSESKTVMDKISGMIPPPTAGNASKEPLSESVNTEDDDWE